MRYSYVNPSVIKMVEYHVDEGESDEDKPTPKRRRSGA
jgi:hypothetical protein